MTDQEQEIVARAITQHTWTCKNVVCKDINCEDCSCRDAAEAAIAALDIHRIERAGEVARALLERRNWTGLIQPEGKPSDAELLSEAAALISSLQSEIEKWQKIGDDILRTKLPCLSSINTWAVHNQIIAAIEDLRLARSRISDGAK